MIPNPFWDRVNIKILAALQRISTGSYAEECAKDIRKEEA
jgi:hypothetical protein